MGLPTAQCAMMKPRRVFSGRRRRGRRHGALMVPLSFCQNTLEANSDGDCATTTFNLVDFSSLRMTLAAGSSEFDTKELLLHSLRFQYAYNATAPVAVGVNYQLEVRSAIVLLPWDEATSTPLQIPHLFGAPLLTEQETQDKPPGMVLWRGLDWVAFADAYPYFSSSGVNNTYGSDGSMVHVKTKRRIDKAHRLYWMTEMLNQLNDVSVAFNFSLFGVAAVTPLRR